MIFLDGKRCNLRFFRLRDQNGKKVEEIHWLASRQWAQAVHFDRVCATTFPFG